MLPDLTKRISREGEQEFACIMRQRSGIDSGNIDMGVRIEAVSDLTDYDQQEIVSTAFCLLESILGNVRKENRDSKKWWLQRIAKSFSEGDPLCQK